MGDNYIREIAGENLAPVKKIPIGQKIFFGQKIGIGKEWSKCA